MIKQSLYIHPLTSEVLEYQYETINGYVFCNAQGKRVEMAANAKTALKVFTFLNSTNMIKVIEKSKDVVNVHFAYDEHRQGTQLCDTLMQERLVDVYEIKFNTKTRTGMIIGKEDINYNATKIENLVL